MNAGRRVFRAGGRALAWMCAGLLCSGVWPVRAEQASGGSDVEVAGTAELLSMLARVTVDMRGVFAPVEGRELAWEIAWTARSGEARCGELSVKGEGADVRIALEINVVDGRGTWRVEAGRVDVGRWAEALRVHPQIGQWLSELALDGTAELSGAGEIDTAASAIDGEAWLDVKSVAAANESSGWKLENIALRAGGRVAELLKGDAEVELRVGTITTSRFGARAFAARGRVVAGERVNVDEAGLEIAGGEVSARPFTYVFAAPALDVSLGMRRVGLQDLVVFMPETFSDARGRVDGTLRLTWSPERGVEVGAGELAVEKSEPTVVRLTSNPGFLTESMPARFTFLPVKWGWLSRLFSARNEAYDTLSEIERGKLALRVESMEVRLSPEGDARGRTARVLMRARPEQGGTAVGSVNFEINVSGPLAYLLRIGMGRNLSMELR